MRTSSQVLRTQFVICLAGHIDHGKSAIVHALTGASVDRLPEEKRRGITIDLGFSHFDYNGTRFALIDVPGHERFIHTMVAGASGVDAAILVVAADDSVMPQTREHLALLELLGVTRGVVAITKCDLADDEQLGLVDMEVAELVEPTFLRGQPRVRVSTPSSRGIAELRDAIVEVARQAPESPTDDMRFRLPVDRVFSAAGQGAVVTGTVWRGAACLGDTLHLLPSATEVRVRRLQSQGTDVERVTAGERAAINLAGIKGSVIRRGDELATPHAFTPSSRHLVQLRILPDACHTLKHRQFARVHLGANQTTAQVLLNQRSVGPAQRAFAILRCETPIVATYGQPFVLRQPSPARTVGGGIILAPALRSADRQNRCMVAAEGLSSADEEVRLAAFIELRREAVLDDDCETWVGLNRSTCEAAAEKLASRGQVIRISGVPACYVSAQRFCDLKQLLTRRCQAELDRRRPASFVLLSSVLSGMKRNVRTVVLDAVLNDMAAQGELVLRGNRLGMPTGAQLSNRQRSQLSALLAAVSQAGPTPPSLKEFAELHGLSLRDLEPLVQVAVDDGLLVRLSSQFVMDRTALEGLRRRLVEHFDTASTAKVGEIREQWGITRKHAVPIFEYFDQLQITSRNGDIRTAGPSLSRSFDEEIA